MQLATAPLEELVRDALAKLCDPVALRAHRLGGVLGVADDRALTQRLLSGIDELKPASDVNQTARAWRAYRVIHLRYVEGLTASEAQHQMALSKSQFYREHEAALSALTAVLCPVVNQASPAVAPAGTGSRILVVSAVALLLLATGGLLFALEALQPSAKQAAAPSPMPAQPTLQIYAGTGQAGYENGPGALARFAGPFGLAVDSAGIVYVADTGNHRIRTVLPTGVVGHFAGSGTPGYADGPDDIAEFNQPNAVTVGPGGTVYVGEFGNVRVRAVSPLGVVSTLAGSGRVGYRDGQGTEAEFGWTAAVVADQQGNIYLPDRPNNVIRRITPQGVVTTHSGSGIRGHLDGPREVAQFNGPQRGGCVDGMGDFYVLETVVNRIRKVTADGSVTTIGGTGPPGFADGPAGQALFSPEILGMCSDPAGNLYVMDSGNRRVRLISAGGMVSTVYEFTDPGQAPGNLKLDRAGNIYLSDRQHNVIYKLTVPRP